MAKPPQDPGSGPRIRARARGGTSSIRPEVVDALGDLERSLSEVAKWEQMLAGRPDGGPVVPALPEGYVGLSSDVLAPPADPEPEVPVPVTPVEEPEVREVGILDTVREAEESAAERAADDERPAEPGDDEDEEPRDAAAAADALVAPLLTQFPAAAEPATEAGDGSVLWAARTVETPAAETEQLIARRRRHARLLSWAGAIILVAGAALWLVPDRSSDDDDQELPAVDVTATTRPRTQVLEVTGSTATTATTAPTTTVGVTATTRRTTPTTRAAAPATTTPATSPTTSPGATLPLPGPPGTVKPNRPSGATTTTTTTTTTTEPPTTTTIDPGPP